MGRPPKKEINLTKESMLALMQEIYNELVEQRRETEKFIKESIGTKEDFLMTILTTATNRTNA